MHVIEVIPLKRGTQLTSLSYFSGTPYKIGSIIRVPIRDKDTPAVVTNVSEVSTTKTALRAATFSLRKLPQQDNVQCISLSLINTAEELGRLYASQIGAVLYSLLAPEIRSGDIPLPHTPHVPGVKKHTPLILEGSREERYIAYRSLIRETFSHSGSLIFVVPSSAELTEAKELLSPGIEERVILLSGTLTKRDLRSAYEKLGDFTKSKLIITTPTHALLERHDITTIVVEHTRSGYYKFRIRPYLDYREVLKIHAEHTGRQCVFGELLHRTEEEVQRRLEVYGSFGEAPRRLSLTGEIRIIKQKDKPKAATPFKLFSPDVITAIRDVKKRKEKVFLLSARKGLAPVVACGDCGFIFRSKTSGTPYSLVRLKGKNDEEERWFVCSVSGEKERAADTCPQCGSWRLRERGVGIQHVYDELSQELEGEPIITFDHLSAKTYKRACFLRDTFYKTKGAIMIGTIMALPYLYKPYDTSVVVNLDSLKATPTWRQQEESLALLLRLREQTKGLVYIQTRTSSDGLVELARRGSIEKFYDEEIELRKTFNYPPFTVFIHLTWQGTPQAVLKIQKEVEHILRKIDVTCYSAPPTQSNSVIRYGLIRFPSIDWPDESVISSLRQLPPSVRIVFNPDRIV